MRPLEDRFPGLYSHLHAEVTPAAGEDAAETKTEKDSAPSISDVVRAVLSSHGVHDNSLAADVANSVEQFIGHPPVEKEEETETETER